jgi:hypothetical protein
MHHAMEVDSLLCVYFEALEEEVHEKSLSSPDSAPQVHAADSGLIFAASGLEKRAQASALWAIFGEARLQALELTDDLHLCRILDMAFTAQTVLIGFANIQSTFYPVFSLM